jgi:chorismate mutase
MDDQAHGAESPKKPGGLSDRDRLYLSIFTRSIYDLDAELSALIERRSLQVAAIAAIRTAHGHDPIPGDRAGRSERIAMRRLPRDVVSPVWSTLEQNGVELARQLADVGDAATILRVLGAVQDTTQ